MPLLLSLGASPDARDVHGHTPLHLHCAKGRLLGALCLLHQGCDANAREKDTLRTPLHLAGEYGHGEVRVCARVCVCASSPRSPPCLPSHERTRTLTLISPPPPLPLFQMARVLLAYGAKMTTRDAKGLRPKEAWLLGPGPAGSLGGGGGLS